MTVADTFEIRPASEWDDDDLPFFGRPEWMKQGACRGQDPDVFFPHNAGDIWLPQRICDGCPVKLECLEYALEQNEDHGIWGGESERSRRRIRARRRAIQRQAR